MCVCSAQSSRILVLLHTVAAQLLLSYSAHSTQSWDLILVVVTDRVSPGRRRRRVPHNALEAEAAAAAAVVGRTERERDVVRVRVCVQRDREKDGTCVVLKVDIGKMCLVKVSTQRRFSSRPVCVTYRHSSVHALIVIFLPVLWHSSDVAAAAVEEPPPPQFSSAQSVCVCCYNPFAGGRSVHERERRREREGEREEREGERSS